MHSGVVVAAVETDLLGAEADAADASLEFLFYHLEVAGDLHHGYGARGGILCALTDVVPVVVAPDDDVFLAPGCPGDVCDDVVGGDLHVLVRGLYAELHLSLALKGADEVHPVLVADAY